jgi:hypothetical protein
MSWRASKSPSVRRERSAIRAAASSHPFGSFEVASYPRIDPNWRIRSGSGVNIAMFATLTYAWANWGCPIFFRYLRFFLLDFEPSAQAHQTTTVHAPSSLCLRSGCVARSELRLPVQCRPELRPMLPETIPSQDSCSPGYCPFNASSSSSIAISGPP